MVPGTRRLAHRRTRDTASRSSFRHSSTQKLELLARPTATVGPQLSSQAIGAVAIGTVAVGNTFGAAVIVVTPAHKQRWVLESRTPQRMRPVHT